MSGVVTLAWGGPSQLAAPRSTRRLAAKCASLFASLCALLFVFALPPASAQTYPARTVTLICPFPPGGSADIMARLVAQKLSEALSATVIVENKPGGGSAVGSVFVAKARPDGHTLLLITGAYPAQAALTLSPQFDALRDIAMISTITSYPFVVNVVAGSPWRSVSDLVAYAKANPGKLNYSTSGVGSIHHLSSELFNAMAGTEIVHIPTKGGNQAMTELLAGRIDILFEAPTLSLPYIKSGKLRALAVTSPGRWKAMPEVAPVAETLPGYEVASFIGVATTAGTPKAVIARLNREIRNIIEQSDTARRLAELGGDPQASSPEEMQRLVEATSRKWRNVIDVRKIERQ